MPKQPLNPQLNEAIIDYPKMESAIKKIDRRLGELKLFELNSINASNDSSINILEHKLDNLLVEIFGRNTIQYNDYKYISNFHPTLFSYEPPLSEIHDMIAHCIKRAIDVLETIKSDFQEKISDADIDNSQRFIKAYEYLELHQEIANAANNLYIDGHYSNAIESAVKALNNLVRLKSGILKDGVSLMQEAFSPKNPLLKFNSLQDNSDRDEQKGFMDLFTGAVTGLRNPRAHKIIQDDPERTLEFIAFISLLAKLLDEAKK